MIQLAIKGFVAFVILGIGGLLFWMRRSKQGTTRHLTKGGQPTVELWVGAPGNGKSHYAATRIEEFLLYDRRPIVTSLAICLIGWDNYMSRVHGFDNVKERLFTLDELERRYFFNFRGLQKNTFTVTSTEQDGYQHYGYKIKPGGGVIYVLDEVHKDFRARETGKTPGVLLEYLSQSRQFGDRIIAITQHPKQLDVCFTRIADRFCTFTNTGKRRMMGLGFPRTFIRNDYGDVTMKQNSHEGATIAGFNANIAELYDTAAAAGGGSADKSEKAPKIFNFPVLACALVLVLVVAGFSAPKYLTALLLKKKTANHPIVATAPKSSSIAPLLRSVVPIHASPAPAVRVRTMLTVDGKSWFIRLTDGFAFNITAVETPNGLDCGGFVLGYPSQGGNVPVKLGITKTFVPSGAPLSSDLLAKLRQTMGTIHEHNP